MHHSKLLHLLHNTVHSIGCVSFSALMTQVGRPLAHEDRVFQS
jgi:hypothetical protein